MKEIKWEKRKSRGATAPKKIPRPIYLSPIINVLNAKSNGVRRT